MTTHQKRPKVYRLQGLPDRPGFDRHAATQLIASAINDPTLTAGDIEIYSLALTVDPHKIWNRRVATVMFHHTPSALATADGLDNSIASEWQFPVPGFSEPLVLDSHFLGLTVLNDVSAAEHRFDCIVLSGLASHPFGSWQPKGDIKSYMWIRDTLPTSIDGVRFILFGYDTTLKDSDSFQTIVDLSNSLYLTLQTNGWASPSTKPLVFIAHSLGGVLLKQLLVILAGANESAQFMLSIIKGAIFFGTPSRGMAFGQLLTMVGDRPNKDLVEHLSETSDFLPNLEKQFAGISHLQRMRFCWAYETKTSPTVHQIDGEYKRSGPRSIMVDRQSATGTCTINPSSTIQIDEDHSNMVKLNRGDHRIPIIINKIREMCFLDGTSHRIDPVLLAMNMSSGVPYASDTSYARQDLLDHARKSELVGWDWNVIISSLKAPERDQRMEQIDQNFGHTFSWALENSSIGLSQWLRMGEGIFWVNGKPGSGKSTFMKFLLNHDRTKELLRYWRSKPGQVIGSFFFHHRGTHLQKSFDGLLSSLLSQLLEGDLRLHKIVGEFFDEKAADMYEAVQSDVNSFFELCEIQSGSTMHRERMATLLSENPSLRLHHILEKNQYFFTADERMMVKRTLLHDFDALSLAIMNESTYDVTQSSTIEKLLKHFKTREMEIEFIARSWCGTLNISARIHKSLREANLNLVNQNNEKHIARLVERQRARQKRLISIQLMQWTQSDLEQGLRRVFDQNVFDLEVCLFFDALDEYAGSPEVISSFLEDLVNMKTGSKTRTKILFSSRPWTTFRDHFGTYPNFSMHEHTMEDIHEYCAGSLLGCSSRTKTLIRPFVEEIANRARGVFLWVKLVMTDLVALVATPDAADDELSQKLRQCLASLPDELEEYYSTIVHRLPESTRRQSYILLECLSRSYRTIALKDIPRLLACGMSDSLREAETVVESGSMPGSTDTEGHVRTISGGIVDIVKGSQTLQFMHQTVREWVELPTFKHNILGTRADMTWENGHSFLVKYYVYLMDGLVHSSTPSILDHLVQAEMTTGVSQYMYLSKLPRITLGYLFQMNTYSPTLLLDQDGGLNLAAHAGLSLYLADSLQHDRLVFQNSKDPLISNLLQPVRFESAVHQPDIVLGRLESVKLILNNGFKIQQYSDDLSSIFDGIWRSPDQQTAEMYTDLALTAVRNGLPVAMRFRNSLDPGSPTSLLHLSPPRLAKYLLEKDANINMLNRAEQTPLDYVLEPESVFQRCAFGLMWLYDIVDLLIKNSAQLRKGTRHSQRLQAHKLLERLNDNGYDIGPLLSLQNESLSLDEQDIPPSEPGNGSAGVPTSDTPAGQETMRSRRARLFGRSGGFFRR